MIFAVTRGKWTNMVQSMKKFKKVFYVNQFSYTHKMIYILDIFIFIFQTLIQEKLLRLCFILFMFSWTNLVQSSQTFFLVFVFYHCGNLCWFFPDKDLFQFLDIFHCMQAHSQILFWYYCRLFRNFIIFFIFYQKRHLFSFIKVSSICIHFWN